MAIDITKQEAIEVLTWLRDQVKRQLNCGHCDLKPTDWMLVGMIYQWMQDRN